MSLGDYGKILLVHERVRMPGFISVVRTNELLFIKYFDLFQIIAEKMKEKKKKQYFLLK